MVGQRNAPTRHTIALVYVTDLHVAHYFAHCLSIKLGPMVFFIGCNQVESYRTRSNCGKLHNLVFRERLNSISVSDLIYFFISCCQMSWSIWFRYLVRYTLISFVSSHTIVSLPINVQKFSPPPPLHWQYKANWGHRGPIIHTWLIRGHMHKCWWMSTYSSTDSRSVCNHSHFSHVDVLLCGLVSSCSHNFSDICTYPMLM